ncbi:MAG: hypothetical protein WCC64_08415, partial [Aliidongia sp.]
MILISVSREPPGRRLNLRRARKVITPMAQCLPPTGQDLVAIGRQGKSGMNEVMGTERLHIPAEAMVVQVMFQYGRVKTGVASVNVYDLLPQPVKIDCRKNDLGKIFDDVIEQIGAVEHQRNEYFLLPPQ